LELKNLTYDPYATDECMLACEIINPIREMINNIQLTCNYQYYHANVQHKRAILILNMQLSDIKVDTLYGICEILQML